jgi:hypothetical protein
VKAVVQDWRGVRSSGDARVKGRRQIRGSTRESFMMNDQKERREVWGISTPEHAPTSTQERCAWKPLVSTHDKRNIHSGQDYIVWLSSLSKPDGYHERGVSGLSG